MERISLSSLFKPTAYVFCYFLLDGFKIVICNTFFFIEKICFHVLDGLQILIHVTLFLLEEICAYLLCSLQILAYITFFIVDLIILFLVMLIIVENYKKLKPERRLLSFTRFLDSKIKVFEGKAFKTLKTVYSMAIHDAPHLTFYFIAVLFSLQYGGIKLFAFLFVIKCCFIQESSKHDSINDDDGEVSPKVEPINGEADGEESPKDGSIDKDAKYEEDGNVDSRVGSIDENEDESCDNEERSENGLINNDDNDEVNGEVNLKDEKNVAEDEVNSDNDKDEAYETSIKEESMDNHDSGRTSEEWIVIEEGVA